jgi:HD-GYP domain-containing protein (c-di-GMP phosphodiesterase class II)
MQSTHRFLDSILPEDRPRVVAEIEKQKHGIQTDMEYRIQHSDGSVRWVWDRAFPILDEDGQVSLVAGLASDITERKKTTERIQTQVERLKALSAIDNAISTSMDMRLTLDIFLREAMSQLKVDAADILLLNNTLLTLEYISGSGFNNLNWGKGELKLGEGLAGRAALKRQRIRIPNLARLEDDFIRSNLHDSEGFITYFGVPLIAKGQIKGVLEIFHRSELDPDPEWLDYLNTLAGQAAIAIDNAQLFEGLQRSNFELIMAYDATIAGWSHAMDLRDKETEGHTQRVTETTVQLAERMGISKQEQVQIRRGALLHDIGKLGVPDHILLKPGKLTDEEWVIMRQHPTYAYVMLLPIQYLRPALDIPYCHHEKWDGSGYPRKLKGEEIPLSARIFAVVDVWDALRSDRPYRDGWSAQETRDYILAESGKHFDPRVVEAFMKMIDETTK